MEFTSVQLRELLNCWARIMEENRGYLIDLDSVVGDGDLGLTMGDGFAAAAQAAAGADTDDLGKICYTAGKAMSTAVPSSMGTLMASGLMQAGKRLRAAERTDLSGVADLFEAFFEGVQKLGKAQEGEKTFLDGLGPAVRALREDAAAGTPAPRAFERAAQAAQSGFEATREMRARHGRAGARGEASRGLLDPGAAVAALLMRGLMQAFPA